MLLILSQTPSLMGMWSIMVGLRRKRKTIILGEGGDELRQGRSPIASTWGHACGIQEVKPSKQTKKAKIQFIPFRLLQENKQDLCKKVLELEQEVSELKEENSIL